MENNQIRQLLIKYYDGNTTLQEERILREYFAGEHKIDAEWIPLKKQFDLFDTGRLPAYDAVALESKIMNHIASHEQQIPPLSRRLPLSKLLMAASLALMIGISALLIFQSKRQSFEDTYTDPQLAYLETQKTLLLISQKINKGIEPLSNVSKINTGADQLKNLGKLDESLEMLNLVSLINQSSNLKK
jgi:hypothetical protein